MINRCNDVNDRMTHVLDRTSAQAMELTDHIFWRLVQLFGVIFLLALAYRAVSSFERRRALRCTNQG